MMTLSIVSHRQGRLVEALLADLARIASPAISSVVVTRNVDEPPIVVPDRLAPVTTMIDNARPAGFGANHNAAFGRCASPLFAVVNPDIRLGDDPFGAIRSSFGELASRQAGAVALVSPRIVAPDGRDEDAARRLITPWGLIAHRFFGRERRAVADFDWLAGMFLVMRSDAFRAVGGFDPRYFMYCEDFDLCARLRLAGWSLVVADRAHVVHDAQRASHRSMRHLGWHVASLVRMWLSPVFWRYRRAWSGRSR